MVDFLFKRLENVSISYFSGGITFLAIVAIRYQLEMIFESRQAIAMHPDFSVSIIDFFHVVLSWASVFVSLVLGLIYLGGIKPASANRIALVALPLILLPPIFDALFNTSGQINYQFNFGLLTDSYLHLFNPFYQVSYVTLGVRIEIFCLVIFSFAYVYVRSNQYRLLRAFVTALWSYSCIFIFGFLPAIWNTVITWLGYSVDSSNQLMVSDSQHAFIWYLVFIPTFFVFWFAVSFPTLRIIVLDCLRPTRSIIYLVLFIWGFIASSQQSLVLLHALSVYDLAILFLSLASILSLFVGVTAINDLADRDIDVISNPNRPLASGKVQATDYQFVAWIFISVSLLFGMVANMLLFYPLLTILSLSYLYSCNPFRLRRYLGGAHLVITLIAGLVFVMGGILVHENLVIRFLPQDVLLPVCLLFFIGSHFKDLKDCNSDAQCGVTTIATVLGYQKAYYCIGLIFVCVMLLLMALDYFLINWLTLSGLAIFIASWLALKNAERLFPAILISLCLVFTAQS